MNRDRLIQELMSKDKLIEVLLLDSRRSEAKIKALRNTTAAEVSKMEVLTRAQRKDYR